MASERRKGNHNRKGYTKSTTTSKRSKRGVNIHDIDKLKSRPFKIIETTRHDFNEIHLADIPTKEDKAIQKHQTTRTLHKKNDISVPEFHVIRHQLPHKSLNPCFKSVHHVPFTLPNHYIQYQSCPDRGYVSFDDFYDLKKHDIDWLIQQLLMSSINDNDHDPIIHKRNNANIINQQNISGQHLVDIINKQYQIQRVQYKTKLINAMKKKQSDKESKKEHSVSSNNSATNSNHNSLNGFHNHNGHPKDKKRQKTRSNSPKKDKNSDPFMNQSSFSLRATSLSLDVSNPFCSNKTPPPNGSMFQFNETMMREHSMSPANNFLFPDDASFMTSSQSIPGLFQHQSYPDSLGFGERSNSNNIHKNTKNKACIYKSKRNDMNITIGNTRLTRLSLSKLLYFLEYEMYRRAKYKGDPERYFPLNDVLYAVKNWDPSYDIVDIERLYYHWIQTRRNNGKIQEKSLIRKFQEPPDTNDDDSNIAFRPRLSDERHVATRRQTKKPKKNTKESYIRLQMFLETMQKQCSFWKKQLEIEGMKRKMVLRAIHERQDKLHESPYIMEKAKVIDCMDPPDSKHNELFNTFSSHILCETRYKSLQYMDGSVMPYSRQNSSVMKLNDNVHDVKKYKKKWEHICNRIVPSKPDIILEAIEEYASHLKTNHIDALCLKIGILPLSDENARRFGNDLCFDLTDERAYHWEINMNDAHNDKDNEDIKYDDITYSEKEERIIDNVTRQRYNTIQERLLNSISYDTDVQYTLIKKKGKVNTTAVAVPWISTDGALHIKVYHPMIQTMDHVEYEPTPIHDLQETDTMFDEFQIPIEPTIAHYNPHRKVLKTLIGRKRKHRALSSSSSGGLLDLISSNRSDHYTIPPAPKRQKLLHSTAYGIANNININASSLSLSAPPLKKAQSLSQITNSNSKKKKINTQKQSKLGASNQVKQSKKFTKNSNICNVSMKSMLEQNKHRQQYIQLQQKSQSQQLQLKKLRGINQNKSNPKQTPNNGNNTNANNSNTNSNTNTANHAQTPTATPNTTATATATVTATAAPTNTKSGKKAKDNGKESKKKKKDKSKKKKDRDRDKKEKKKKKSSTKKKSSKSWQKNTITTYAGFGNKKNDNNTGHKSSKSKGRSNAKNIRAKHTGNKSKSNHNHNESNNKNDENSTTLHNSSLSTEAISNSNRLPTPDANPHNNPTPPPAGRPLTASMPLSAMPHLPKFDVKFDPSMMSKFKMDINIANIGSTDTAPTPTQTAAQTMTMNNTPPTPPTNLQFNTMGRPKKVTKKLAATSSTKLTHHHPSAISAISGRPANMQMSTNSDKRKATGCITPNNPNNPNNKQNNRYSFMSQSTDNVGVIAMPPNPSNTSANSTNSNTNTTSSTRAQRAVNRAMNSIPVSVPVIPQLPQLPAQNTISRNASFAVNNPPNTRRSTSNNATPKSVPALPSFPQQSTQRAPTQASQQYAARNNVQQPPSTQQQQRIHRQSSSHQSQRVNAQSRMQQQQQQTSQTQRQRAHSIHKTQPPFPPSFGANAVPPPPSAMPSNVGLPAQYNSGPMRNRPQRSSHHQASQASSNRASHASHIPQFGATPSINQSSMMSPSMNTPPTMHNHPMSYSQRHRNNTVPPMHSMPPNNIPLSPRQMSEMRHNRMNNAPMHSNVHNNRNKQMNAKEIIELDQ